MKKIITLISIVISLQLSAKTYYVSLTGNNASNGLTTATAWRTLTYAAGASSPVVAGDIVYIKAGSYGNENVVFAKSGKSYLPISYIGYRVTPNDLPPILALKKDLTTAFDATLMPLYTGSSRATGTGFDLTDQSFITIKNIQLQQYNYGLITGGTSQLAGNNVLSNINVSTIGNTANDYSGRGIMLGNLGSKFSNNNKVENCLVVNSASEGLSIYGNSNKITGCKVYCNDTINDNAALDYYLIVVGSYNAISNCYVYRKPNLDHAGHGFTLKSNAEQVIDDADPSAPTIDPIYNTFDNCVAVNMGEGFCVRHRGVQYNTFRNCTSYGTFSGAVGAPGGEGNGIAIRDGASNNTFDNISAFNCANGIRFFDSVEDGDTGGSPTGHPGNNNVIKNSTLVNCYIGVYFDSYGIASDAGSNTIQNTVFYKCVYTHEVDRHCVNMNYKNNVYFGCLPISTGGYFRGSTYATDVAGARFKNCDFWKIEGGMPVGFVAAAVGSFELDPIFNNADAFDFTLNPSSPCKGTGLTNGTINIGNK